LEFAAFNLNSKGTAQMVTVGCVGINSLCDPNMRIWEVPQASNVIDGFVLVLIVLVFTALFGFLLVIFRKRRRGLINGKN
jgi:hypothetical protein